MRACNVTKINMPPWVFFTFFKWYKWYQIDPLIQIENFRRYASAHLQYKD